MPHPTALAALLLVLGGLACTGPKHLDTTLGGRRADSLVAEARKVDGRWQVELLLPVGQWQVEVEEAQAVQVLPGDPRATLRWVVDGDRWRQQDRPFRFTLMGAGGLRLPMAVRYPNTLPKGLAVLLEVISGRVPTG
jgi:hypothetical protein